LQIDTVADRLEVARLEHELDLGEAEAIVLARQLRADVLLMDERIGRRVAVREGVPIIGLMGVLVAGKQRGFVPSVRVVIGELESKAGFRVSARVKQMVFNQAGE
jgi:predicted nucleic acid-binding protein